MPQDNEETTNNIHFTHVDHFVLGDDSAIACGIAHLPAFKATPPKVFPRHTSEDDQCGFNSMYVRVVTDNRMWVYCPDHLCYLPDDTMSTDFKAGIVTGLAIYGVGALLTVIIHLIVGWDYAHGPPTSFIAVVLTLLVGVVRFFITMRSALVDGVEKGKGEFIVHCVVALVIVLFIVWLRYYY